MNGHECRHINGETACFFHKHVNKCAHLCGILDSCFGANPHYWNKNTIWIWDPLWEPTFRTYIQDHRTCYKPWKSTPRPPLVRKQMQLINLSFPVSVCNKPTTSYNMINQKKRYQIQISSYSRSCHCSTISTKIWKHFGILQKPHSEPRRWRKKRDNAPDHPNRIGVATYCFENDGQD